MSREIDRWPTPAKVRPMKVIVASPSRSGTLSMYTAMKVLGFRSYHFYECVVEKGLPHINLFNEAATAQYNRLSGIKRYTRADFDKWLHEYDCLVEIPSYMGKNVFEAYANEPEVKFILTERQPEKWARSVNNSAGGVVKMATSFPISVLKYFDATLFAFMKTNVLMYNAFSSGTNIGDPDNEEELCKYYNDYIKMAKETIPAERLHIIKLENGVDWEDICPFLGVPIPDEEYPTPNDPENFKALVNGFLKPRLLSATMKLSAVALPALGILGWASIKFGPPLLATLRGV
ncbi:uncharacterized protein N7482_000740 [Penicillium canariense]|uniref:P-loop containing nucleoside triphosphate hydrolase protein n=1 Tax=Penicillium canariense TaxID=189055 RepID=A0A9W9IBZ0_9EURO|nr:uncharacterized protein N7482_000740 [Penicillium canariense]KAJ5174863.1 hypothetical protein N7482_000740 [Penicillium canariense]